MISQLSSLLENKKITVFLTAAIVGVVLFFAFVFIPTITGLIKIMPEVSSKTSRVNIMKADILNIANYQDQIVKLNQDLSSFKSQFSTKEEISPLLKHLSDTAKAFDVRILSINPIQIEKPKEPEQKPKKARKKKKSRRGPAVDEQKKETELVEAYKKVPINISAISSYHSFGKFLNSLEHADTFMRVGDLKITGDDKRDGNHLFSAIIVTYILIESTL